MRPGTLRGKLSLFKIRMADRKDNFITSKMGGKLRNKVYYGSNALWDAPTVFFWGGGARLLGKFIMTCNGGCRRTANFEDVLDIDEKHLTFIREGQEMLGFAVGAKRGNVIWANFRRKRLPEIVRVTEYRSDF